MQIPRRAKLKIDAVIPNPRNDRRHGARQLEQLKASIAKFGQPRPVLVRKQNLMLIAGHGVHQAMADLHLPEIDALVWDVDQATADQYLVADNRFSELSNSDEDRRRDLLDGIDEGDFAALGFLPEEVEKLFSDSMGDIEVREIETDEVFDRFWISVAGPLAQQAVALKKIQELMSEFPDVQVELGTTR